MEGITSRHLRILANPGGQIIIPLGTKLMISDWLGKDMVDRSMLEEIKHVKVEPEPEKEYKRGKKSTL